MFPRAFVLAVCLAGLSPAALLRIELSQRSDILGGQSFGSAGPYERLIGKAYFAVDPSNPANRIICDIDKAPKNANGLVEFSADLYVLKPRDLSHGNGAALFEVSNRGGKGMLGMYNHAAGSLDPRSPEQFGDNFLLDARLYARLAGMAARCTAHRGADAPLCTGGAQGDRPITGLVRSEFVPDRKETRHSLADREHIPYKPVNPDDPALVLTVRDIA